MRYKIEMQLGNGWELYETGYSVPRSILRARCEDLIRELRKKDSRAKVRLNGRLVVVPH